MSETVQESVAVTANGKGKGKEIPVSIFTGFLGAGKTTIILSLLKQLPKDYKVCLLKNEFGDVEVDSELAKESNIEAVSEILNGCMCCVLVGQMRSALLEIQEQYAPDRIIIESSGSAFPATLAWQVRQLEEEGLLLDAVVTVIDCVNFKGYEDTSPTAKMQAKYTDLLLLNKHELTTERQLDAVLDSLYELNPETPKLRISRDSPPEPSLVFGLLAVDSDSEGNASTDASGKAKESRVFGMREEEVEERKRMGLLEGEHASGQKGEVETVTVWSGGDRPGNAHAHTHEPGHEHGHGYADAATRAESAEAGARQLPTQGALENLLGKLPAEDVWRVKGFLRLSMPTDTDTRLEKPDSTEGESGMPRSERYYILNWAFGRHELVLASPAMSKRLDSQGVRVKLTIMGARGEVKKRGRTLAAGLNAELM